MTDAIVSSGRMKGFFDPRYTCEQDNSSPELRWEDEPKNTAGFVLIFDETLSGASLWVVYQIPASVRHLPAGIPSQESLPNGIRQGLNDQRKLGYSGPCPPTGESARDYRFEIFALRSHPFLESRATRGKVLESISPFILDTAHIIGRYQRALRKTG